MKRGWVVLMVLMILGACAPSLPQPTPTTTFILSPTPTSATPPATPRAMQPRSTLPPTWTPTATPTATQTPTITPTPSITPSPTPITEAALCAEFRVTRGMDGLLYEAGESVVFLVYMPFEGATIDFRATHATTKEVIQGKLAGTTFYQIALDPVTLPASGRYDWTMRVSINKLRGKCTTKGYFLVDNTPPEATAEATAETTSEAAAEETSEATAEITPEATSEATAEVTAASAPHGTPTRTGRTSTPVPTPTRRP